MLLTMFMPYAGTNNPTSADLSLFLPHSYFLQIINLMLVEED